MDFWNLRQNRPQLSQEMNYMGKLSFFVTGAIVFKVNLNLTACSLFIRPFYLLFYRILEHIYLKFIMRQKHA